MTDDPRQSGNDEQRGDAADLPRSLSALIRCAADDELTAEMAAEYERRKAAEAESESRVAFDQALRARVGAVMSQPESAPPSLRDAVAGILEAGPNAASAMTEMPETPETLGGEQTRSRAFWSGDRLRRFMAAAAAVVVMGGVVFVGQQIFQAPSAKFQSAGVFATSAERARLVNFLTGEHNACSDFGSYFSAKMNPVEAERARAEIGKFLNAAPVGLELEGAGYTFAGYGQCAVPGGAASVHMIYRPAANAEAGAKPGDEETAVSPVSLFIQKDNGWAGLEENRCYVLREEGRGSPMFVWRRDGLIYYLVNPDRPTPDDASRLLGAPEDEVVI